jgi:hypothetical protein
MSLWADNGHPATPSDAMMVRKRVLQRRKSASSPLYRMLHFEQMTAKTTQTVRFKSANGTAMVWSKICSCVYGMPRQGCSHDKDIHRKMPLWPDHVYCQRVAHRCRPVPLRRVPPIERNRSHRRCNVRLRSSFYQRETE